MKKRIIISTIIVMLFSIIYHGAFKLIKIPIFPVNESIWEHGKMITLSFISLTIIEKYLFKRNENILISNFLSGIICIILDFIIFSPIYFYILKTNDNMIITIAVYILCIMLTIYIKEKHLICDKDIRIEKLSIFGYLLLMSIFLMLTYKPIRIPIFYDYNKKIYGINLK